MLSPNDAIAMINRKEFDLLRTCKISPNFTWGEVFDNRTNAQISECAKKDSKLFKNFKAMADFMQEFRRRIGNRPIVVTSWYRPLSMNVSIGGSSTSYHVDGLAVDFIVSGQVPRRETQILYRSFAREKGCEWGLGRSFTHLSYPQKLAEDMPSVLPNKRTFNGNGFEEFPY